jgi:hypothetical protein
MGVDSRDRNLLKAELLRGLGLDADAHGSGGQPSPRLIGAATSLMVRRAFSGTNDVRAITAYVRDLFEDVGNGAQRRARLAEALIRSELGELELIAGMRGEEETLEIARAVLADLCRKSRLDLAQVERLVDRAARDSLALRKFVASNRVSGYGLLARALRRRSG